MTEEQSQITYVHFVQYDGHELWMCKRSAKVWIIADYPRLFTLWGV